MAFKLSNLLLITTVGLVLIGALATNVDGAGINLGVEAPIVLPSHNVKGFLAVEKLVARADADENGTDLQTSIDHNKIIDARLAELKALSVADGLPQLDG